MQKLQNTFVEFQLVNIHLPYLKYIQHFTYSNLVVNFFKVDDEKNLYTCTLLEAAFVNF